MLEGLLCQNVCSVGRSFHGRRSTQGRRRNHVRRSTYVGRSTHVRICVIYFLVGGVDGAACVAICGGAASGVDAGAVFGLLLAVLLLMGS